MAKYSGGCVCGAIRYESDADPIMMFKCHCRDCQHVTGGGYSPVLFFSRQDLRIIKGTPKEYATQSLAGGEHVRGFCGTCGSRLSGGPSRTSIGIMAGSLDDPSLFRPTMDIFVEGMQPWDLLDAQTTKFEQYPSLS